jgi:hypothetical protein
MVLARQPQVRRWDDVGSTDTRSTADHQTPDLGKPESHFKGDVTAARPAKHHDIHNPEHSEDLNGGVRKTGPRIAARRVRCVVGLAVPRQIEGN